MSDENRTYEIITSRGRQRITVPAAYKVTFGAVVPGAKASGYSGGGWGLRIWESADKQRAVFTDVVSFRDLSIPVEVQAIRKFGTDDWFADDGSYVGKKADTVERAWKPIEEIKDQSAVGMATLEVTDDDEDHARPFAGMTVRKDRSF